MRRLCLGAWRPSLAEIQSAPELAILAALHASIHAASFAIGAANPELADPDLRLRRHDPPAAELLACAAGILTDLALLARSIDAYRIANASRLASNRRPMSDDDFPF